MKNKNLITLEEFKEKNYGKRGTKKRDELEAVLKNAHNTLEAIARSLAPYLPNTSTQIFEQLETGKATALFPRIEISDDAKIAQ